MPVATIPSIRMSLDASRFDSLLTVILILKDRPRYTLRLMRYLDKCSFPFKLIIADGGCCKRIEQILSNSTVFKNLDFDYIRYPYDKTYFDYYKKIHSTSISIKSRYCIFADNDNFYSVPGLRKAIEFLECNPDYAACQGLTVGFRLHRNGRNSYYYGKNISLSRYLPHYSLEDSSAVDRLSAISNKNFSSFYCVQKTTDLRDALSNLARHNPANLDVAEIFLHFYLVSISKIKCLDIPYLYRQFDVIGSSHDADHAKGTLFQKLLWDSFVYDVNNLVNSVSGLISTNESLDFHLVRIRVRNFFQLFFAPSFLHHISREKKSHILFGEIFLKYRLGVKRVLLGIYWYCVVPAQERLDSIDAEFGGERKSLMKFLTHGR